MTSLLRVACHATLVIAFAVFLTVLCSGLALAAGSEQRVCENVSCQANGTLCPGQCQQNGPFLCGCDPSPAGGCYCRAT